MKPEQLNNKDGLVAIYPGSFDPLTVGHMDVIKRASNIATKLIIGIGNNGTKTSPYLNPQERLDCINACLIEEGLKDRNIEVKIFEGLLVDFATQEGAKVIFRGLRAFSDFDFEFNLASSSQIMNPNIESVFLMTSVNKQFISSRLVREIFDLGGEIKDFVPPAVLRFLLEKKKKC